MSPQNKRIRRVASRPVAEEGTRRWAEELLQYGQVGCGVPAGLDLGPRVMQLLLEADPTVAIDSEDCVNAFNELFRRTIADTLFAVDKGLYRHFVAYYFQPTRQFFRLANGRLVSACDSRRGLVQGDPLAALIFDIVYTIRVLKPTAIDNPNTLIIAVHDDSNLSGRPCDLPAASQRFLTRWSVALARANAQLLTRAVTAETTSPPPSPERDAWRDEDDDTGEDEWGSSDSEGEDSDETVTGAPAA